MNSTIRVVVLQSAALLVIALLVAIGPGVAVARQADAGPPPAIPAGQLDQLVAPIALYPDPLLAQVLAAATFPLDIVQADRWVKQHKNLKGQQLTDAVVQANLPYDPSIISLVQFPTVLDKLSREIDWSTQLGNAFLTQRGDVMDSVQRMRRKAEKIGNLKSSEQIKVVSSPAAIEIQPAQPEVIYVPAYNPQVVYVQPPAPSTGAVVATGLLSFGMGVAVGAAASHNSCCWYGGSMAWSSHTVVVANNSFNRTWATRGVVPPPPPYYRAGGAYPAGRPPINGRYSNVNANRNVNVNNVNVNRNKANVNTADRAAPDAKAANRNTGGGGAARGTSNRSRSGGADQPAPANRGYSQPSGAGRSSAFSGAQNGSKERAASTRGQATRGSRQK